MNPEPLIIPKGPQVMIGASAQPDPDAVYEELTRALRPIPGIAPMHMPQMYMDCDRPSCSR